GLQRTGPRPPASKALRAEQHTRRELPLRIECALDGAHLFDPVCSIELTQQELFQRAPPDAVLGERRATHRDDATCDLQDRVTTAADVFEASRHHVRMKIAVRDMAPDGVVESAVLEGGPI